MSPPTEHQDVDDAPHPRLPLSSWGWALRRAVRGFLAHGCLDLAAGLTFRTVLSLFPALIAIVSIVALFGQRRETVEAILEETQAIVPESMWEGVEPTLESVLTAPSAGLGLILGLIAAMWTTSNYIRAFGRAMNIVYGMPEGRGLIKLFVQMYLLTAFALVLTAVALLVIGLSGPIAEALGAALGLGEFALAVWDAAKWLMLAAVVITLITLLYNATPNMKRRKVRWLSPGAVIVILTGTLATMGFVYYLSNFGSYNPTYGTLAGVIIFLLWTYVLNSLLLLGAEVNAEVERVQELRAGLPAEEFHQLPARDTKASEKRAQQYEEDVEWARNLRMTTGSIPQIRDPEDAELSGGPWFRARTTEATAAELPENPRAFADPRDLSMRDPSEGTPSVRRDITGERL